MLSLCVCEVLVCERWYVTKLCVCECVGSLCEVMVSEMVCDKVVCVSVCVELLYVKKF